MEDSLSWEQYFLIFILSASAIGVLVPFLWDEIKETKERLTPKVSPPPPPPPLIEVNTDVGGGIKLTYRIIKMEDDFLGINAGEKVKVRLIMEVPDITNHQYLFNLVNKIIDTGARWERYYARRYFPTSLVLKLDFSGTTFKEALDKANSYALKEIEALKKALKKRANALKIANKSLVKQEECIKRQE